MCANTKVHTYILPHDSTRAVATAKVWQPLGRAALLCQWRRETDYRGLNALQENMTCARPSHSVETIEYSLRYYRVKKDNPCMTASCLPAGLATGCPEVLFACCKGTLTDVAPALHWALKSLWACYRLHFMLHGLYDGESVIFYFYSHPHSPRLFSALPATS